MRVRVHNIPTPSTLSTFTSKVVVVYAPAEKVDTLLLFLLYPFLLCGCYQTEAERRRVGTNRRPAQLEEEGGLDWFCDGSLHRCPSSYCSAATASYSTLNYSY